MESSVERELERLDWQRVVAESAQLLGERHVARRVPFHTVMYGLTSLADPGQPGWQ